MARLDLVSKCRLATLNQKVYIQLMLLITSSPGFTVPSLVLRTPACHSPFLQAEGGAPKRMPTIHTHRLREL